MSPDHRTIRAVTRCGRDLASAKCMRKIAELGVVLLFGIYPRVTHAIIGGEPLSAPLKAPANAVIALQLGFEDDAGKRSFKKASAVAIRSNTLLTAAHNLYYIQNATDIEAIFSPAPCWGKNTCGEYRIRGLKKIIHPDFRNDYPQPPVNDVALLVLEKKIPPHYDTVRLPEAQANLYTNTTLRVYGFGKSVNTAVSSPLSDFRLRSVTLSMSDPKYNWGTNSLFWVSQKNNGFCAGDSGGPALHPNMNTVLGVASHTKKDKDGTMSCLTSGGFVDITHYMRWIKDVLTR